jgi:hypothetical protein
VALADGDEIVLRRAFDLGEVARYPAVGVNALAVSGRWLAWRQSNGGRDLLRARRISDPATPGPVIAVAEARDVAQLGRPSLDGGRLVYAKATGSQDKILKHVLGTGAKAVLRRSVADGLSNPSIRGDQLLFVRHQSVADRLVLGPVGGGGNTLLSRREGTLWSTALAANRAYVTVVRGTAPSQRIISVER